MKALAAMCGIVMLAGCSNYSRLYTVAEIHVDDSTVCEQKDGQAYCHARLAYLDMLITTTARDCKTGKLATIYADQELTIPLSNPFLERAGRRIAVWAAPGTCLEYDSEEFHP